MLTRSHYLKITSLFKPSAKVPFSIERSKLRFSPSSIHLTIRACIRARNISGGFHVAARADEQEEEGGNNECGCGELEGRVQANVAVFEPSAGIDHDAPG